MTVEAREESLSINMSRDCNRSECIRRWLLREKEREKEKYFCLAIVVDLCLDAFFAYLWLRPIVSRLCFLARQFIELEKSVYIFTDHLAEIHRVIPRQTDPFQCSLVIVSISSVVWKQ